jgi:hypothetical protein
MYGMNFDQFSEGGVMGAPLEQFNPWAQSLAMANRQQMQQPMGKPGLLSPMPSLAMPGLAGMTPPAGVPVKPGMDELIAYSQPVGGDNDYVSQAALASRLFGQGGDRQGGANQFRKPLRQRGGPFNFLGGFQF